MSSIAASLDCRSRSFTRSACIDVASSYGAFQQFLGKPHGDLPVQPGPLEHERVEIFGRHRPLPPAYLAVERGELPAEWPYLQRPARVHIGLVRIRHPVLGLDAVEPRPRATAARRQ